MAASATDRATAKARVTFDDEVGEASAARRNNEDDDIGRSEDEEQRDTVISEGTKRDSSSSSDTATICDAIMDDEKTKGIGNSESSLVSTTAVSDVSTEFSNSSEKEPHEMFVELAELSTNEQGEPVVWKEKARYIKYEENFEEGVNRWGKPHVASLSFHSLLVLRKCIKQGTVLLDLQEGDYLNVIYQMVNAMVKQSDIKEDDRAILIRTLLLRHRHINERTPTPSVRLHMRKLSSGFYAHNATYYNDGFLGDKGNHLNRGVERNGSFVGDRDLLKGLKATNEKGEDVISLNENEKDKLDLESIQSALKYIVPQDDHVKAAEAHAGIMKRLPDGSEGTSVLVGSLPGLTKTISAFVRMDEALVIPHLLEGPIPVRFFFVLLGPPKEDSEYLEVGRSLSALMANSCFNDLAYTAHSRDDLLRALDNVLNESLVLPPAEFQKKSLFPIKEIRRRSIEVRRRGRGLDDTERGFTPKETEDLFRRTGRPFRGVINDIKKRYPWYWSDIKDGFNFQCIAAAIFIFFAALSGTVSFGGLMSEKTKNLIGVSETLVVTAICGIIYSLLAAQPLLIIGTTATFVLLDEILFNICEGNGIEFLPIRVWISFWVVLIATVFVAFEGSVLVKFFTRFIQEIFAALVALLFIYESLRKLYMIYVNHPLLQTYCDNTTLTSRIEMVNPKHQPNTAFFSTILMLGTFIIALKLKQFRNSKFLGRSARRALGDFGVPIAIVIMVCLDYFTPNTYTQKLLVPDGLTPSDPEVRGWFVSPLGMRQSIATWHVMIASIGALLVFILVFLETEICELILNKKERMLRKGTGFHVDLLLVCYMEVLCAVLGGPWMCAATIRSVSHVVSLTVMSRTHAPGEVPHVVKVKEQRISNLLVSLLIGLSILMAPVLQRVPIAVLFGVFLYMGVSSMSGIHFFERIYLFFMPVKHHPDVPYVKQVRTWKMNCYTGLQLFCLAILWVVKSTVAAIAFPFVLLAMVPMRMALNFWFTDKELHALDGDRVETADYEDEPDIYEQIVA